MFSIKEFLANGTPLQFGNPKESAEKLQRWLENKYVDNPWGCWVTDAIPSIVELCKALTKNLKQNYESLKNFIQSKKFDEVIVMGHSFMGVDKPYYDDIIVPCLEKCKWTFYVHKDDDKKNVLSFKQEHPLIKTEEIFW
ncbi:AbiH family protein [Fibrobacter sp.]